MALVKCPDCGSEVSDQAPACPRCGRPMKVPSPVFQTAPTPAPQVKQGKPARPSNHLPGWFVLVTFICLGLWLCHKVDDTGPSTTASASAPAPTPPTAEEKAKKEEEEKRFQTVVLGAKSLKAAMRDPDSFVLESAFVKQDGTVCYEYRSKNGFGGYSRESAIYTPGISGLLPSSAANFAKQWNKRCAGEGQEYAKLVKYAM